MSVLCHYDIIYQLKHTVFQVTEDEVENRCQRKNTWKPNHLNISTKESMKIKGHYLYSHTLLNDFNNKLKSCMTISLNYQLSRQVISFYTKTNLKIIGKWKPFHSQLSFQVLQNNKTCTAHCTAYKLWLSKWKQLQYAQIGNCTCTSRNTFKRMKIKFTSSPIGADCSSN